METVMIDTSAVYALLDRSDKMHDKAKECLLDIARNKSKIMLTNFIVAECHALISSRLNHKMARDWIKNLCWPVERVSEEDENRAVQIIMAYEDKTYSYTDATTFAVMERIGLGTALAFDHHFAQYGFITYSP
jgi:uncharacterized protein